MPWAMKSQISSAVTGRTMPSGSAPSLVWAVNMTVSMVSAAMRRGSVPAELPGVGGRAVRVVSSSSSGACARRTSAGWLSSSRGANSVNSGRCAPGIGPGELEQPLDGGAQRVDGRGLGVGGGRDLAGGAPQRVLKQGQQELVLAVEVLVEAAQ